MRDGKPSILWVDDDAAFIPAPIQEVELTHSVDVARDADEFFKKLIEKGSGYYAGFIIDVLLPYGESVSGEAANGGLRTGLAIIERVRAMVEFREVPIIIFTIRWATDVDDFAAKYSIPVVRKQESLEDLLAAVQSEFK